MFARQFVCAVGTRPVVMAVTPATALSPDNGLIAGLDPMVGFHLQLGANPLLRPVVGAAHRLGITDRLDGQ